MLLVLPTRVQPNVNVVQEFPVLLNHPPNHIWAIRKLWNAEYTGFTPNANNSNMGVRLMASVRQGVAPAQPQRGDTFFWTEHRFLRGGSITAIDVFPELRGITFPEPILLASEGISVYSVIAASAAVSPREVTWFFDLEPIALPQRTRIQLLRDAQQQRPRLVPLSEIAR